MLPQIGRHSGRSANYFFIVIVIRHETTAAARWALLLIVRTLFNDAITVAVWTGFHGAVADVVEIWMTLSPAFSGYRVMRQRQAFADPS
jgi:hypothetical protein